MSQVVPIHPEEEQFTLPITFPKSKERFKVTSPEFKTDLELAPRTRVKVSGIGYIGRAGLDFSKDENGVTWAVILDEADLEYE